MNRARVDKDGLSVDDKVPILPMIRALGCWFGRKDFVIPPRVRAVQQADKKPPYNREKQDLEDGRKGAIHVHNISERAILQKILKEL